jgi:hypothetical protein
MSERDFFHPQLPSLEQDCAEEGSILTETLDDYYASSDDRPLVADKVDLLEPVIIVEYLESLTAILGGHAREQFLATHAAFHFAVNVAGLLDWQVNELDGALPVLNELPDDIDPSEARETIIDMAQVYLQARPRLDGVFATYSSRIDVTDSFSVEAEAIYALTLRQIEFAGIRYCLRDSENDIPEA